MRTHLGRWLLAAIACTASAAGAQPWQPERPIRIVVPFAAGGVTDALLRAIQEPVSRTLGQSVVVENRPGAAGAIAARQVADAPADGHTLLVVNTGLTAITPFVQDTPELDPRTRFTAVSGLSSAPSVLLVHPDLPAQNVAEFIDYARAHPGRIDYAVVGKGAYGDLATANFSHEAGIEMTGVSYQGNAQSTIALLSGEVQAQLTILSGATNGYIREGRIKALGVATTAPSPLVPGVPLIADHLPGFEAVVYTGLVAPAGTPQEAVARLSQAVAQALQSPGFEARLEAMGMASAPLSPEQYTERIHNEIAQFAPAVQRLRAP